MGCWLKTETTSGIKAAGLSESDGPWILLHVNALAFSDEAIAQAVRECEDAAWYAEALNAADHLTCNNRGRQTPYLPDYAYEYRPILERYADRAPIIREALGLFAAIELREARRAAKSAKRKEVQKHYDRLFMALGRRDGFHCASCRATTDLQIDHMQALANGGTNDLDNLQLLCGPCNSRKGVS